MSNGMQREPTLAMYAALLLPTITSHPSSKSIQWSADGQACFVNKGCIVILTPDHGINFDIASTTKSAPHKDDPALGWFKTMVQNGQTTPIRWPDYSQAWGAASLGSIDLSVIALAISPTGVSANGGCVFATLSSNMDLHLWAADRNYLKGEWKNIFELTPHLLKHFDPIGEPSITSVLSAQTVCIEWTPQAHFGIYPTPAIDASLLVLGGRAGCLTFIRHRNGSDPEILSTLDVAEEWVTQVAFSSWNVVTPGHCEGYLAYGTSDGSVGLITIIQKLEEKDEFSFSPQYTVQTTYDVASSLIYGPERRSGITAMRWIQVPGRSSILVVCHPGLINLWSAVEDASGPAPYWTGTRSLRLQTQKICVDSSAFHPVSGITYLRRQDRLVITLYDGSFHVIRNLSADPNWATRSAADVGEDQLTSESLSFVARSHSIKAEKEQVDRKDMLRIDGAVQYDDNTTFMWVYESARPSDFSYKHDAKHNSTLVVAQMWKDDDDDLLLRNLSDLLRNVKTSSGLSPLHLLRPFLLHLRNLLRMNAVHTKFLELLRDQSQIDDSTKITVPELSQEMDEDMKIKFRQSLSVNLFGWDDLLSLRMKLSLGDFAWKLASNERHQTEIGVVAQGLLNTISHRVLRAILRHLFSVHKSLTSQDVPFISRVVAQSMLPGCPADLSEEGQKLYVLTRELIEGASAADGSSSTPSDEIVNKLKESCPACGLEIPLQDITTGACPNGHTWARCSVTTFILSTTWTRTCVGCSRKAYLPPTPEKVLPVSAQGWVVEDLLKAVHRCLFCSNGFVSIL